MARQLAALLTYAIFGALNITGALAQNVVPQSLGNNLQQQIAPSDERMGGIIAQQALINARLSVELDQARQTIQRLQADLAKERVRADAAEAKKAAEPKDETK